MKAIALGVIGFVPLVVQAATITIVNFADDTTAATTSTVTDGFAVPIGTNGAETTYLLAGPETTTITTTVNGAASTTTQTTSASHTLIASASGYKLTGVDGLAPNMDIECRYTGKDAGECVLAAGTGAEATTVTIPGRPNDVVLIPVSDKTGGASPTGGNGNGNGNGSGNSTSSGNGGNGGNGAVGITTGKQLMLTFGGLVLGALAIF